MIDFHATESRQGFGDGVQTKELNQAVKNNPEKFYKGYILELNESEKIELVKNFDRFEKQKHSTVVPKAFTEKGVYIFFFGRDESRPYRI